jgi:hypothetical protein
MSKVDTVSEFSEPVSKTYAKTSEGKLVSYSWPGMYPVFYSTADAEIMCPACASGENGSEAYLDIEGPPDGITDPQWEIVYAGIHWEGKPLTCSHCQCEIESAYGEPE